MEKPVTVVVGLRFVEKTNILSERIRVLQQKTAELCMDASGSFCGYVNFSDWEDVPLEFE